MNMTSLPSTDHLTLDQCIGHLLCPLHSGRDVDRFRYLQEKEHYGSVFFNNRPLEEYQSITNAIQDVAASPVIMAADLEAGAKSVLGGHTPFPWSMASGAAMDLEATEEMGRATALEGRHAGLHWTFGPVVDINYNWRNGVTNIRSYGDRPQTVIDCASAFIRGVQENGRMAACAKHFPGDGMDERDQHLVTSVNSLTVEAWMETYGKVWKAVFAQGVKTVMTGHISFPAWQGHATNLSAALPATLCAKLQIDLLRQELGFDGLLVSDAAPMVGLQSRVREEEAVIRFLQAGGDVYLFAEPEKDFQAVQKAVISGDLSEERVRESAARVLALKDWLGLAEETLGPKPTSEETSRFEAASAGIAAGAITIQKESPSIGKPPAFDARILTVTLDYEGHKFFPQTLEAFEEHLRNAGYTNLTCLRNPPHGDLVRTAEDYDTIFLNIYLLPHMIMGQTRLFCPQAMTFWRGFYVSHPDVRCTSFGTPYVLFDQPHLPNMLLAYSGVPASQRAAVDVWLGRITATGTSPVRQPETVLQGLDSTLLQE